LDLFKSEDVDKPCGSEKRVDMKWSLRSSEGGEEGESGGVGERAEGEKGEGGSEGGNGA